MNLTDLLEAQLPKAEEVADPDVTQIRPRLQREGDLVWHLHNLQEARYPGPDQAKLRRAAVKAFAEFIANQNRISYQEMIDDDPDMIMAPAWKYGSDWETQNSYFEDMTLEIRDEIERIQKRVAR